MEKHDELPGLARTEWAQILVALARYDPKTDIVLLLVDMSLPEGQKRCHVTHFNYGEYLRRAEERQERQQAQQQRQEEQQQEHGQGLERAAPDEGILYIAEVKESENMHRKGKGENDEDMSRPRALKSIQDLASLPSRGVRATRGQLAPLSSALPPLPLPPLPSGMKVSRYTISGFNFLQRMSTYSDALQFSQPFFAPALLAKMDK
jgi:hypothetical protein